MWRKFSFWLVEDLWNVGVPHENHVRQAGASTILHTQNHQLMIGARRLYNRLHFASPFCLLIDTPA